MAISPLALLQKATCLLAKFTTQELDPDRFCRIHRSTIVNLERIQGLKVNKEGEYDVILRDGTRLRLNRGYRRSRQLRIGI